MVSEVFFIRGESIKNEMMVMLRNRRANISLMIQGCRSSLFVLKYRKNAPPAPRRRHRRINQEGYSTIRSNSILISKYVNLRKH